MLFITVFYRIVKKFFNTTVSDVEIAEEGSPRGFPCLCLMVFPRCSPNTLG